MVILVSKSIQQIKGKQGIKEMKKLTARQKLDLINYLCSDIEMDSSMESQLAFSNDVYEIAHPSKDCSHPGWEDKWFKVYKELKRKKII